MSVKQISVFLENKASAVFGMTNTLAQQNIDMRALSLVETNDFGIVRIIVDDVVKASEVLQEAGFVYKVTDVICVCIPDEPGGLNKALQVLSEENLNVEYLYAVMGGAKSEHAYSILRLQEHETAEAMLKNHGLMVVDQEHIAQL